MPVDLTHLLRLRLAVARFGEMNGAVWWNTQGVLGSRGPAVYSRGFPKTHYFAQGRVALTVAARRSVEVFDPRGAITLWRLSADIEQSVDRVVQGWLDQSSDWEPFFRELQTCEGSDLLVWLKGLELITGDTVSEAQRLGRSAEGRAVPLPGVRRRGRRYPGSFGRRVFSRREGRSRGTLRTNGCLMATVSTRADVVSSFTIIKGALVEETYAVFQEWDLSQSKKANLDKVRESNSIGVASRNWLRDVCKVLNRRFEPGGRDRPLVLLAKAGVDREVWRPLLLWHMTRDEFLLRDFLTKWLFTVREADRQFRALATAFTSRDLTSTEGIVENPAADRQYVVRIESVGHGIDVLDCRRRFVPLVVNAGSVGPFGPRFATPRGPRRLRLPCRSPASTPPQAPAQLRFHAGFRFGIVVQ